MSLLARAWDPNSPPLFQSTPSDGKYSYLSDFQCISPSRFCSSLFGQRPQKETKSCRMGRGPASQPSLRLCAWQAGPQAWLARPQAWLDGPDRGSYRQMDGKSPLLQDFIPYWGRCPQSWAKECKQVVFSWSSRTHTVV